MTPSVFNHLSPDKFPTTNQVLAGICDASAFDCSGWEIEKSINFLIASANERLFKAAYADEYDEYVSELCVKIMNYEFWSYVNGYNILMQNVDCLERKISAIVRYPDHTCFALSNGDEYRFFYDIRYQNVPFEEVQCEVKEIYDQPLSISKSLFTGRTIYVH